MPRFRETSPEHIVAHSDLEERRANRHADALTFIGGPCDGRQQVVEAGTRNLLVPQARGPMPYASPEGPPQTGRLEYTTATYRRQTFVLRDEQRDVYRRRDFMVWEEMDARRAVEVALYAMRVEGAAADNLAPIPGHLARQDVPWQTRAEFNSAATDTRSRAIITNITSDFVGVDPATPPEPSPPEPIPEGDPMDVYYLVAVTQPGGTHLNAHREDCPGVKRDMAAEGYEHHELVVLPAGSSLWVELNKRGMDEYPGEICPCCDGDECS